MNEMKLQVKSLLRIGCHAYDLSEHPNKSELKRMGEFITGNPIVRMNCFIDFIFCDYKLMFSWGSYNLPDKIEIGSFRHDSHINITNFFKDQVLKGIEFELFHDLKNWYIREKERYDTMRELRGLMKNVEKWQYIKSISDQDDHISNIIKRTLQELIDNYIITKVHTQIDQYNSKAVEKYSVANKQQILEDLAEEGPTTITEDVKALIENEKQKENNLVLSTIEDWIFMFKDKMSDTDYYTLVWALMQYFETGNFPDINNKIKVGKVNKKLFGWALNQIYRAEKSDALPTEYLLFAKQNISLFTDVDFDESDILKSNLYKYFTTKT